MIVLKLQKDFFTMANREENAKRLRYIRILERFSHSIITYLSKSDEISHEVYNKRIKNNIRYYEKTEKVHLYKGDYNDLEALVLKMLSFQDSEEDIDEIRNTILRDANKLEQTSNNRKYKKDKHKNSIFDGWE